ncbi:hybrid-cluster NAD(P)-dependent oxidoreductase [Nocardioides salarius]|uniref:hybrid-cluster NAD(P)-dependent oxidoreductase n=1 Tax=Nocardioides salarius TaxID=374513 RepID=UPI0030F9C2ED
MSEVWPAPRAQEVQLEPPGPALRVVPDTWRPVRPLGQGVLADPALGEGFDTELVLRARVQETHDVVSLVLEPASPSAFAFRPGQFLTLGVDVDGQRVERCYTISSPPTRPHLLRVTVKRVEGGGLSPYLHDRLAVGDRLHAAGPLGGFTVTEHPAARYLLLSAGSGITPTLATLRTMADLAELEGGALDVVVVHSARTPDDLVGRDELEHLAAAHEGLRVVWVCEDDPPGRPGAWTGWRGRLDAEILLAAVPDATGREVLTCGPPGYMAGVRAVLAEVGAEPARCHEESFVLGAPGAPAAHEAAPARESVPETGPEVVPGARVRFGRSDREVVCPPGTTVLAAAQQAGVRLPSSCSSGLCGTCKSTLLAGRVDMVHQGGIRPREIAQDKFLPCCSTPDGDIVVDA